MYTEKKNRIFTVIDSKTLKNELPAFLCLQTASKEATKEQLIKYKLDKSKGPYIIFDFSYPQLRTIFLNIVEKLTEMLNFKCEKAEEFFKNIEYHMGESVRAATSLHQWGEMDQQVKLFVDKPLSLQIQVVIHQILLYEQCHWGKLKTKPNNDGINNRTKNSADNNEIRQEELRKTKMFMNQHPFGFIRRTDELDETETFGSRLANPIIEIPAWIKNTDFKYRPNTAAVFTAIRNILIESIKSEESGGVLHHRYNEQFYGRNRIDASFSSYLKHIVNYHGDDYAFPKAPPLLSDDETLTDFEEYEINFLESGNNTREKIKENRSRRHSDYEKLRGSLKKRMDNKSKVILCFSLLYKIISQKMHSAWSTGDIVNYYKQIDRIKKLEELVKEYSVESKSRKPESKTMTDFIISLYRYPHEYSLYERSGQSSRPMRSRPPHLQLSSFLQSSDNSRSRFLRSATNQHPSSSANPTTSRSMASLVGSSGNNQSNLRQHSRSTRSSNVATNFQKESQLAKEFRNNKYLKYDSWYDQDTVTAIVNADIPEKVLYYTFERGVGDYWPLFFKQLNKLIQEANSKGKVYFITTEPGAGQNHFIAGMVFPAASYSEKADLLIINPVGLTEHKDFRIKFKEYNNALESQATVYISKTKFQHDLKEVVSCGPLCVEIIIALIKKSNKLKKIQQLGRIVATHDLGFSLIEMPKLLPAFNDSTTNFVNKMKSIRQQHYNRLLNSNNNKNALNSEFQIRVRSNVYTKD